MVIGPAKAKTIAIEHKGVNKDFIVDNLVAKEPADDALPYYYVEKFLQEYHLEDELFAEYINAYDVIYSLPDMGDIKTIVMRILKLVPVDIAREFFKLHADAIIPPDIADKHASVDTGIGSQDQTYIREEYFEFIILMFYTKLILPPLGLSTTFSPDLYQKGMEPLKLIYMLEDTEFFTLPGTAKLTRYITKHVERTMTENDVKMLSARLHISMDSVPHYVMGNILFKRLPLVTFSPKENLASMAYNAIMNSTNRIVAVKDRMSLKTHTTQEEEEGLLDSFRGSTPFPLGRPVEFESALFDIEAAARHLGITDMALLNDALKFFEILENRSLIIHPISVFLVKLALKPILAPTMIDYIAGEYDGEKYDLRYVVRAFALAFAKIYPLDNDLGLLIAMRENPLSTFAVITPTFSRVPKELSDELMDIYPVTIVHHTRVQVKNEHTPILMINQLASSVKGVPLTYFAPRKYLKDRETEVVIPGRIRILIAELLLKLYHERKLKED